MKPLVLIALLAAAVSASGSAQAADETWTSLFNGKDLEGWEQKGGKAVYSVEDGAIVGQSVPNTENSFLCSKEEYGDFILEFEFLASPDMNSGVQFRGLSLPNYKNGRVHGYQCELEDEGQERDWFGGIYDEARRGWLFPTKEDADWGKAFGEAGKKIWKNGEWNTVRIEAKGDSIKTFINGEMRADLKDDLTPKGFIGLQVHGVGARTAPMTVKWRNLRIQVLD